MEHLSRRLDDMQVGAFHRKIMWLSAMGPFLDGYDLSIIGVAMLLIKPEWSPTPLELGFIGASALMGAFVGALVFGRLTDRLGRKTMYVLDLLFFVVFAALSGMAQNMWELLVLRFLLGVGVGADYPISSSYITEFAPAKDRGRMLTTAFMFWMAGSVTSSLVGVLILNLGLGPDAWRYMLASGVIPALIVIWLRRSIPESPRWYIARGKTEEAKAVILGMMSPAEAEAEARMESEPASRQEALQRPIWALFQPQYLRRTLFIAIPWFLMDVAGYGIGIFTPTLLTDLGFSSPTSASLGNALLSLFGVFGVVVLIFLVDNVGRKPLQTWGFVGNTAALGLLAVLTMMYAPTAMPIVPLLGLFAAFNFLNNLGPGTTTWYYPTELFPTDLRATAQGFATAFSRIGASMGIVLLPVIQKSFGIPALLGILAGTALLGALVTASIGLETKGVPLERLSGMSPSETRAG